MNSATAPALAELHPSALLRPAATSAARVSAAPRPVAMLGIPFDPLTIEGTLDRIDAMIASRQPHYVVTANVDFLTQAAHDVELRRILLDADLVLCDGTPLLWLSRWLGNRLPERVAGSDLAPQLIARAAAKGHRIFLLGAAEGVAAEASAKLLAQHPTLQIAGHYSPPFASLLEMDHAEIERRIRAARADILLVSFGCPKQEKWVAMHYRSLGVPVAIGVGATIDFLAGRVKRAPNWMRRSGTEWIYRLLQEPKRLYKRYAGDLVHFLPAVARQARSLSTRREFRVPPVSRPIRTSGWCCYDVGVQLNRRGFERDRELWARIEARPEHTVLDLSHVRRIDATGVAFLTRHKKTLAARSRHLVLLSPSPAVRRALATLQLSDYFAVARDRQQLIELTSSLSADPVHHDAIQRSLAWHGELVAANVGHVWSATLDHLQGFVEAGATRIDIDLSRLRFIDSSGAALMLRVQKWARERQISLRFSQPQANIRNVLRLTRLEQTLLEGGR